MIVSRRVSKNGTLLYLHIQDVFCGKGERSRIDVQKSDKGDTDRKCEDRRG